MIPWPWLLFTASISGLFGWLVCALCSAASIDPEPEQDESHSATRYTRQQWEATHPKVYIPGGIMPIEIVNGSGERRTLYPIIPEAVKDRIRAEWVKPAEVEPCDDPLRGSF